MGWFLPALIGGLAAGGAGAAVGAIGNAITGSGGKGGGGGSFQQVPESAEAVWAREKLGSTLKANETLPGYGAIAPDWADIWAQAQDKVKAYYYGTATAPGGAYSQLRSKSAVGNMLGSPAYLRNVAKMQVEEGNTFKDMAATEAINKADFSEKGRQSWMQGLEALSGNNPSQMYTPPQQSADYSGLIGGVASTAGNLAAQYAQNNWLKQMYQQPSGYAPSNFVTGGATPVSSYSGQSLLLR